MPFASLSDLPIIAQMTIQMDGKTTFGTSPEHFTERLDELGVDVIGLNCGMGPNHVLNALEKMRSVTSKNRSRPSQMPACREMFRDASFTWARRNTWRSLRGDLFRLGRNSSAAAAARRRPISN